MGNVLYLRVLGRSMVILNSFAAARDIMDRKGANNSDRPRQVVQDLLGWKGSLVSLGYGERWRKQRRLMQKYFDQQASYSFRGVTLDASSQFTQVIHKSPEDLEKHIQRLVSGAVAMVAYGHQVTSNDDPLLELLERAAHASVSAGSPGATLLDLFPFLWFVPAWFPGAHFKRFIVEGQRYVREAFDVPYKYVQKNRAMGTANPSFLLSLLEETDGVVSNDPQYVEDVKSLGGLVFLAGAETSESTLHTFFLMMVHHPEVARRAQEEIDRVTGSATRFPTWSDRESLPYLNCILKETYRYQPAIPLGIPHASVQPDTYDGKFIPGGSMLVPNIWQMMHDEQYYAEPNKFLPDRFLQSAKSTIGSSISDDAAADPTKSVFGFGRRICPGRFFADDIIWLTMARVLSAFDILPALNPATGKEALPRIEFTSGVATRPKPFKCRIVPRSDRHAVMIRDDA